MPALLFDCRSQLFETRFEVFAEMHPQGAAAAFDEHLEVSASLSGFDYAKCKLLAGHGKVDCVVAGDLQEHTRVRTALVGLAGGMQEAWTKSEARRHAFLVEKGPPNYLQ